METSTPCAVCFRNTLESAYRERVEEILTYRRKTYCAGIENAYGGFPYGNRARTRRDRVRRIPVREQSAYEARPRTEDSRTGTERVRGDPIWEHTAQGSRPRTEDSRTGTERVRGDLEQGFRTNGARREMRRVLAETSKAKTDLPNSRVLEAPLKFLCSILSAQVTLCSTLH